VIVCNSQMTTVCIIITFLLKITDRRVITWILVFMNFLHSFWF